MWEQIEIVPRKRRRPESETVENLRALILLVLVALVAGLLPLL